MHLSSAGRLCAVYRPLAPRCHAPRPLRQLRRLQLGSELDEIAAVVDRAEADRFGAADVWLQVVDVEAGFVNNLNDALAWACFRSSSPARACHWRGWVCSLRCTPWSGAVYRWGPAGLAT